MDKVEVFSIFSMALHTVIAGDDIAFEALILTTIEGREDVAFTAAMSGAYFTARDETDGATEADR